MTTKFYFRIIWSSLYVAIAIDKKLKNNIKIPVTLFYFWPRVNGWELLKHELNLKPWLIDEERIKILNIYTKVILTWKNNLEKTKKINFIKLEENQNNIIIAIE